MRQYIDTTGKTTDEATNNALRQLGKERSEVSVSILEMPRSGFLGIGSRPAKVRVYYGPDSEHPEEQEEDTKEDTAFSLFSSAAKTDEKKQESIVSESTASVSSTANAAKKSTAKSRTHGKKSKKELSGKSASHTQSTRAQNTPAVQSPEENDLSGRSETLSLEPSDKISSTAKSVSVQAAPSEPKRDKASKKKKSSRNAHAGRKDTGDSALKSSKELTERTGKSPSVSHSQTAEDSSDDTTPHQSDHFPPQLGEELPANTSDEKAIAIRAFLSGLLEQLEVSADIRIYFPEKGRYKVILEGQNLGAIIGRRGETLDAIQQLTSYSVNRTGGRVRIHLDAEGYRAKREETLQRLAQKTAAKVIRFSRSITLEPMNAYERHVIHTALQDYAGVSTHSVGTDPNRRVVVSTDRRAT